MVDEINDGTRSFIYDQVVHYHNDFCKKNWILRQRWRTKQSYGFHTAYACRGFKCVNEYGLSTQWDRHGLYSMKSFLDRSQKTLSQRLSGEFFCDTTFETKNGIAYAYLACFWNTWSSSRECQSALWIETKSSHIRLKKVFFDWESKILLELRIRMMSIYVSIVPRIIAVWRSSIFRPLTQETPQGDAARKACKFLRC